MRKIITTTFVSLDGVMQAPGGPEEDTSGGFMYGGWSFNYWGDNKVMDETMAGFMSQPFDLLLGRKTYDIFASYWPNVKDTDPNGDIGKPFNKARKYVVSHKNMKLAWQNSVLVTGDVVSELKKLKDMNGPDLWVHGSGNLIQTLLKEKLIDRMHIWTFPVTLGPGKRLFAEGTRAVGWKLIDSKTAKSGVIIASYEPTGELKVGSFV
ncbi:MAG: dihydrofolate reductase [Patescibacteria group bacterium]|nr:dihydrofolate reductase [Patescibacteria group bacterium]